MIQPPPGTRVYLACRPVDMRRGFDGLSAEVAEVLKQDPYSGHLFLFRGKRGDYLKILYWDTSGLCLFAKLLEKGKFAWPSQVDATLRLTPAQLALLVEPVPVHPVAARCSARSARMSGRCWNMCPPFSSGWSMSGRR